MAENITHDFTARRRSAVNLAGTTFRSVSVQSASPPRSTALRGTPASQVTSHTESRSRVVDSRLKCRASK